MKRYEMLKSILKTGSRGVIVIRPDPDSLASALALRVLFKKNRAVADIALYEPITRIENRNMVRLLHIPVLPFKAAILPSYDLLCTVDAQPDQFPDLEVKQWDIVIDHHPLVPGRSYAFSDIRSDMGATSSIMVDYLDFARIRITERIATALCYGITTDTDYFQRSGSRKDALAFSRLFPNADHQLLRLIEAIEIQRRNLFYFNLAYQRLEVNNNRAIVHIGGADSADIAVSVADFFARVSGINFVAISCFANEKLVIIFRSRSKRRDAGKIANIHFSEFGMGGGHRTAARAEIPIENLPPEARVYSFDSIEKFIEKRMTRPGNPGAGS
jgi:nanoRNase/pAp phosphatase (c-di-AMP/oligoRNAs hydrolase)